MKRFILLFFLSATVFCYGRQIVCVSGDNAPIPDVRCTGYSSSNDSIASWTSDKNGVIEVQQKGVASIVATHSDFSDKYIKTEDQNSERNVVVMTPAVALNEVVVTPQDVQEFTTHTIGASPCAVLVGQPLSSSEHQPLVGCGMFYTFGKGFKESEHTVRSAPVYADTEINVMDRNNLISFRLSYNFNFGKNKITARPEYDNLDFDSGILRK